MGRRGKTEIGTCNVCSAPCSSCMHRNGGSSGSKSDESCSSQVNNALGSPHNTHASEASNLFNSSHENDESESESSDSDLVELDVKICDICGVTGREDLLAICSRCSDGAEHTYCMRVTVKKVPQGDWLCEECKFAEEAEKKKLEAKAKKETEVHLNTRSKRHIDELEAAPDAKRQAVESPTGSPKKPVLPRLAALSRETSFKSLEKTTRKLAHHSSFKIHASDDTESTRYTDSQPQSPKGSLLKSNSFSSSSSRPKVRPVDYVMHKEAFSKNAGRSVSTRCVDLESSDCDESKTKGPKQLKDKCAEANPAASTVEQKLISRGLTKQARRLSRNRLEDIVTSGGDTSTNENAEPTETLCAPGSNLSTTRNIREDANKGNKLRAAVDAALKKKPSFSKNRGLDQSLLPSVSDVDSSCDKAFQNLPSKVPVVRDWPVGFQGGHPNVRTEKQTTTAVNGKQFTLAGADAVAASQPVEPEVRLPCLIPVTRDLPVVGRPSVLRTTSAIPEPEYIWQGDMEVHKSENLTAMHCGIQAYRSTIASPQVVEVVKQFPVKVNLNEVPRLSTWPTQFQDVGAKEHNVALFFFAKDGESYDKSYKPLVDNMVQKDLALKGTLEGVELLIFTSNQLPHNCQHWNTLLFLWGVFRGKKEKCSIPLKNIPLPPATNIFPNNMGKAFSTRESSIHENPSNRVSSTDSMKEENPKEGEPCGAIDMEVDETEEGEIGFSPLLRDEKITGAKTVNSSDMNKRVDLGDEGPVNKKLKRGTCEEEDHNAMERIVFPLDLNDTLVGYEKNERRSLGMVPNLELALGGEDGITTTGIVVLPLMGGTSSIEEHTSSQSQKPQEGEDAASLSLPLSFSTVEKEQQKKQTRERKEQHKNLRWERKKQKM